MPLFISIPRFPANCLTNWQIFLLCYREIYWNLAAGFRNYESHINPALEYLRKYPAQSLTPSAFLILFKEVVKSGKVTIEIGEAFDTLSLEKDPSEVIRFFSECYKPKALPGLLEQIPSLKRDTELLLSGLINSKDSRKVSAALGLMTHFELTNPSLVKLIRPVLESGSTMEIMSAFSTIARAANLSEVLIAPLVNLLKHSEPMIVLRAAEALGEKVDTGNVESSIHLFLKAFEESIEDSVSTSLCKAVKRIGHKASSAIPKLLTLLNSDNESLVIASCGAITGIGGKAASPALPQLTVLLSAKSSGIVCAACQAIGSMGRPAASAQNELTLLMFSDDANIRQAAKKASVAIERNFRIVK